MHIIQILFCLFLLSCQTNEKTLKNQTTLPPYWPTKTWKSSSPEKQGLDSTKLNKMMKVILDEGYEIDSVTIVRNGFVVTDIYKYPFKKGQSHFIHSITKSILSGLVGIALDKGFIKSIKSPVLSFFPNRKFSNTDHYKKNMTLEHLLLMASGLKTEDSWHYEWRGLTKMKSHEDWVQYLLDLPMKRFPGKEFEYSNGVSYLISAILYQATKMKPQDFAQKYLFNPLGISRSNVRWETDPSGIHIGWGGMHMNPHDMAKFGLLYLNKGVWDGKQIISKNWIESSTKKSISSDIFDNYGHQWWSGSASFNMDKLWRYKWNLWFKKDSPVNYYMAVGYLGQFIYVIPDRNMVVVFTSKLKDSKFFIPKALLDEFIIPSVISNNPIKENEKTRIKYELFTSRFKKEKSFFWVTEKEGIVKRHFFTREKNPSFSFKIPKGSYKTKLLVPNEVMAITTSEGARFSISINNTPKNKTLKKIGSILKKVFEDFGSDINLISNNKIKLNDGTLAYKTVIDWRFKSNFYLRNIVLSVFKNNKWITLNYSFDSLNKSVGPFYKKDHDYLVNSFNF